MIAVFAPSEVPALTSTGRTNSPSFSHTVPVRPSTIGWAGDVALFCWLDLEGGLLASESAGFHERASGTTCAWDDGIQRRATLGTSSAFVSLRATKRTFAVRYGSKIL